MRTLCHLRQFKVLQRTNKNFCSVTFLEQQKNLGVKKYPFSCSFLTNVKGKVYFYNQVDNTEKGLCACEGRMTLQNLKKNLMVSKSKCVTLEASLTQISFCLQLGKPYAIFAHSSRIIRFFPSIKMSAKIYLLGKFNLPERSC